MSVTAGVSNNKTLISVRVKCYWPGKVPEWDDNEDNEQDNAIVREQDDVRLCRLAESRIVNCEEVRADHRSIRKDEEEEVKRPEGLQLQLEEQYEDEDTMAERRRLLKAKLLQREQEEILSRDEEQEEEEEEEESEYETDFHEEYIGVVAMVKPVFTFKFERDTITEREEEALEEQRKRRLEERRRIETKQIVIEEIQKNKKNIELGANNADIDIDDQINEAEEYEAWKVREMSRIKKNRDDALLKEKEEVKRVRNMTEEERRDWKKENPKPSQLSKKKWRFMQKYYHKGAFFQSSADDRAANDGTDNILARDFSAPTGEDKMDKTILPKVMQVKHFGRSGRTKWSHLVKEDTTYDHFPIR
jgi:microfibrillar-associated protein 1